MPLATRAARGTFGGAMSPGRHFHRSLYSSLLFSIFCTVGLGSILAQLPPAAPAQVAAPKAPTAVRELVDLPYVTGGAVHQRLDLLLPADPAGPPRPAIVWIHGGGWQSGSKKGYPSKALVARGYVGASLDYRFSAEALFPAQLEDCKAAIRWLRAHAAEYNLDPDRIGVWGASAGGHLAALLGTTENTRRFDVGENLDQSSAVRCVLDQCGPADFLHWGDPPVPENQDVPTTSVARLIGGPVHLNPDAARAASPIYFVGKDTVPFLIQHGDRDLTVPLQQSRALDAALRAAGVESTLVVVPDTAHSGPGFGSPENVRIRHEFFDKHLRPTPTGNP